MRRARVPVLLLSSVLLLWGGTSPPSEAAEGGPGPARPIWPRKGELDKHLWTKAMSIQSRMWHHLSPEGLLVDHHRVDPTAAELSQDALYLSDAAMWTGCYAASQACRWHVTGDPDALAQVRHLAKGLVAIGTVTGVEGRFARNVGVPAAPGAGEKIEPSPTGNGQWMRADTSRDQLAGVTLGWYFIGRYMQDAELKALAAKQLAAIATRLHADGMWIRDPRGGKTKHGELRPDVKYIRFVKNGLLSAIGLATAVAAWRLDPENTHVQNIVVDLGRKGYERALTQQLTFLPARVTNSNVNMATISLLVLALCATPGSRLETRTAQAMRALRRATVGWWNAGICACYLLGGMQPGRRELRGEVRATLHGMPDRERARAVVQQWKGRTPSPIWQRPVSTWNWKEDVTMFLVTRPSKDPLPKVWWTGADWLFAYWIARAAGELVPVVGPGRAPRENHCAIDYPAWMKD